MNSDDLDLLILVLIILAWFLLWLLAPEDIG